MWTWLFKIDPNVIIPTVLGLATWLYHKVSSTKTATKVASQTDIVTGAVRSILAEIVDHVPSNVPVETYLKGARDYVQKRIWTALGKLGVPQNAITQGFVNAAIEQATSTLATQIADERRKQAAQGGTP